MTEYLILLPTDEDAWAQASPETRREVYREHTEFARLAAERGHTITGGAELTHSRGAVVVRGRLDDVRVTEGPFAEAVEQLGGYYLVQTDDLDDLLQLCGIIAGETGVEVRATVQDSDPDGPTGGTA